MNSNLQRYHDAVIFDDRTLVGPDSAGRLECLNNKFRANDEILQAAGNLRGEDLHKRLLFYTNLPALDKYTLERSRAARFLLLSFEDGGERPVFNSIHAMRVKLVGPIKRRVAAAGQPAHAPLP